MASEELILPFAICPLPFGLLVRHAQSTAQSTNYPLKPVTCNL
jgi:hypothetical protein